MNKDELLKSAQNDLAALRKGQSNPAIRLHPLRESAKEGGFTLADIGTSEEELERFASGRH